MCDRADPNRTEGTAALVNKVKGKKEGREEGEGGWLAAMRGWFLLQSYESTDHEKCVFTMAAPRARLSSLNLKGRERGVGSGRAGRQTGMAAAAGGVQSHPPAIRYDDVAV